MSLDDFKLTKNDSLPSYHCTISRSGASTAPNLAGYTAYLKVSSIASTSTKFTLTVTSSGGNGQITNTSAALVRFDFSTDNWNSTGTYVGEISFESSATKVETAPDRQLFVVKTEY